MDNTIVLCVCVLVRASDDLKNNMVAVDTMEQFQKELDQGKVSNITPHFEQNVSPSALWVNN